jgi:maleate isomerase
MTKEIRLGVITPSGNVVVERVTNAILGQIPDVFAHYTRVSVHGHTTVVPTHTHDFDSMLAAAELLSHLAPDVICWNGSKGGGLGFTPDEELCQRIAKLTGVRTVTSALATLDLLRHFGCRTYALITPYDAEYQQKLVRGFAGRGFDCVSERHSDIHDNLGYAAVTAEAIADMARAAVRERRPDAIIFFCTNFYGALAAQRLEDELGIPAIDATAVGVWASLKAAGVDCRHVKGWGRIFSA